jgi:hypothetical protein
VFSCESEPSLILVSHNHQSEFELPKVDARWIGVTGKREMMTSVQSATIEVIHHRVIKAMQHQ